MTDVALTEAQTARTRVAQQLAAVQARRPSRGADSSTHAGWLRDKAGVHDQIAGYLRRIGDTAGAVEAEVLATRCRADASDLVRDDGVVTTILGPCPGYPVAQPRSQTRESGHSRGNVPSVQRTDTTDQIHDRAGEWTEALTCGSGLP